MMNIDHILLILVIISLLLYGYLWANIQDVEKEIKKVRHYTYRVHELMKTRMNDSNESKQGGEDESNKQDSVTRIEDT